MELSATETARGGATPKFRWGSLLQGAAATVVHNCMLFGVAEFSQLAITSLSNRKPPILSRTKIPALKETDIDMMEPVFGDLRCS